MTIDEVATFAGALPGVSLGAKYGNQTWMVGEHGFAWRRPFSKADLKRFGDETPPAGDILAVKVENLDAKDALLAMDLPGFFTIPHFNGYAAVLIQLRAARVRDVKAAITQAWRTVASPTLVATLDAKPKQRTRRRAKA
jgi:hypothetical protein